MLLTRFETSKRKQDHTQTNPAPNRPRGSGLQECAHAGHNRHQALTCPGSVEPRSAESVTLAPNN